MSISFSLIVPIYNVKPDYLTKIIEQIRKQTYKNFEVIYINDRSTSIDTIDYLNNINFLENEIYVENNENVGLGQSRNIGIMMSKKDYLIFIDSDDQIVNDFLYTIKENILCTKAKHDIYHFNFSTLKDNIISKNKNKITLSKEVSVFGCMSWLNAYKKDFIRGNNIYFLSDNIIHEDEYFFVKILEKTDNIFVIDKCLYIYNKSNENSITTTSSSKKSLENLSVIMNKLQDLVLNELTVSYIIILLYVPIWTLKTRKDKIGFVEFNRIIIPFQKITKQIKNYDMFNIKIKSYKRKIWILYRYHFLFRFLLLIALKYIAKKY